MGIPAIEEVAYSEAFALSPERPEHREVFLDTMAVGEAFPMFPEWTEFYDVVARELDLVWDGQRTAESAVEAIDRQTRALPVAPRQSSGSEDDDGRERRKVSEGPPAQDRPGRRPTCRR